MKDPNIALGVIALVIAIYMFAALKYNALMWIFRIKPGFARMFGMDEEANRRFSRTLGWILCPIIGICALGMAIYLFMGGTVTL